MNTQLRKFQIKICINYINKLLKSKNFSTMFVCETRNKEAHEYESVQNGRNKKRCIIRTWRKWKD